MKTTFYKKSFIATILMLLLFTKSFSQAPPVPTITGPSTIGSGITPGLVYYTEPNMTNYQWTVSSAGTITQGAGSDSITVTWNNPTGMQMITVNYDSAGISASTPSMFLVFYYPFADKIDPTIIPQFVDPLPHFAAGLRVNVKEGGNLIVKAESLQHIALSTGTVLPTGTIGNPLTPNAGKGTYFGYSISKDSGLTYTPPYWPAFTIEAHQGNPVNVEYRNELFGNTYADVNMLVDQTIMMGVPRTGDSMMDPYTGPIPISVHLHGGEVSSGSDGGPDAWFTPGWEMTGPGWSLPYEPVTKISTYPNSQEPATLWFHEHSESGLTRINVYSGLAGFYFLKGENEELDSLPGWSGDDLVREITPDDKTPTFNGNNSYLPEIELAIQDRMFNVNGELYWPNTPENPDFHPYWVPEFFGDVMTVNGKSWPYLSVAPRKYRFRFLDGCHARFLNMWLYNLEDSLVGPSITVVGTDGGLLDNPVVLDPASGKTLLMAPAERYDVIIDFTGIPEGTTLTLMNDANAPYPMGDPVISGLTDRILQFVVNGEMVSKTNPLNPGTDLSKVPTNLRPLNPLVKLTDFSGSTTVTPTTKRQLVLNEVETNNGPLMVLINNSRMYDEMPMPGKLIPHQFGMPTEMPTEGTTETWSIINTTMDAHPMHIHLLQWQLVSRQAYNDSAYMAVYSAAFGNVPPYPINAMYPGGAGSPYPYDSINSDGAIGGNPSITPFLTGPVIPANPEERGWKDVIKSYPGQVTTYIVRIAPTSLPINATPSQLKFPSFDPSGGPGYVWHCHIVDHEDNEMMRPLVIKPSPQRYPQIVTQPASNTVCSDVMVIYTVTATSASPVSYQWQVSNNEGLSWINLTDSISYSGTLNDTLIIDPVNLTLNNNLYRCILANIDGFSISNTARLTVYPIPSTPVITQSSDTLISNILYGNQWFLDGNLLPGDTGHIYLATTSGDYSDRITINGCSSDISNIIHVTITGIDPYNSLSAFNVYPSPNDGHFRISINDPNLENFSIFIYNALGIKIYTKEKTAAYGYFSENFYLNNLPSGIYSIVLNFGDKQWIRKMVIN